MTKNQVKPEKKNENIDVKVPNKPEKELKNQAEKNVNASTVRLPTICLKARQLIC